jgi:hypothetical protein
MYQDQESIKVFERMHARDQLVQLARKMGSGDGSPNDPDLFAAHASAEGRQALTSNAFIVAMALLVLLGSIALFWL